VADPRGFLKYTREGPKRRPVELRVKDYKELYDPFEDENTKNSMIPLRMRNSKCRELGAWTAGSRFVKARPAARWST
jgi:glutamate synthase (NADPH/NADH) small chain